MKRVVKNTLLVTATLFFSMQAVYAQGSCESLRMQYRSDSPIVRNLSATELQVYPLHFLWAAEEEATAIERTKQAIAESILNMVLTQGREEVRSKGDSIEGAVSEVDSSVKINTETQLDIPLPQPLVRECTDNGRDKKMIIYTLTYGELTQPSLKYLKNFTARYTQYKKEAGTVSGFFSLLEAYKARLQLARRPGYLDGALKMGGVSKNELISLTGLERVLKKEVEKITVRASQKSLRLNPSEVIDRLLFLDPVTFQFLYRGSNPLRNLPLLLQVHSNESSFKPFQTDQAGKIQLAELNLKVPDESAGSTFAYLKDTPLADLGQSEGEKQALIDKYCPGKITLSLLIATQKENFGERNTLDLTAYRTTCNSLSYLAFQEAKKADSHDAYSNFLKDYPESPYRGQVVGLLFDKVRQQDSWDAYTEFIERYPDTMEKGIAVQHLSSKARRLPEKSLSEKEAKLERLEFIESYSVGLNSGTISKLKQQIQKEKDKRIHSPATEDAYVLELRTVHVPTGRVALGIDVTGVGDNKMSLAEAEIGYGYRNIVGILIGGRYNNVKWKEPIREAYGNIQFRVFGKRKDLFSIALGATTTWRNDSYDLKPKETHPDNHEGVDKEGESQFVHGGIEREFYLTMVLKAPVISTFFHLYAGSQTARVAIQHFFIPEIHISLEGYYRHQPIEVEDRATDTEINEDKQERINQEKEQRTDALIGIGLSTAFTQDSAQTKFYYSARRKQGILRFSLPF